MVLDRAPPPGPNKVGGTASKGFVEGGETFLQRDGDGMGQLVTEEH